MGGGGGGGGGDRVLGVRIPFFCGTPKLQREKRHPCVCEYVAL